MRNHAFFAVLVVALQALSCTAYVSHGEACNQASPATSCDPNQNLACRGGYCECQNTEDMEWSPDRQVCQVLVGGSCYKAQYTNYPCVPSAFCQYATKQCVCNYQHSPSDNRHCAASYGSFCNATTECNSKDLLVCAFDRCRCPNPINHIFNEQSNRCYIKVEAACNPNPAPGEVTCHQEVAECLADPQSTTGYSCQCKQGFHIEHYQRQCVRAYLQECGEDMYPPCDVYGGLRCFEGRCQCFLAPDQAWDPELRSCASLEGRGCALNNEDKFPWFDAEYQFHCFSGMECQRLPHADEHHKYEGICRRVGNKNSTDEKIYYK